MDGDLLNDFELLLIGAFSGALFQLVSMLYYLNGRWTQVSRRKKFATTLGGGLAALLVGLWILSSDDGGGTNVYRLWFYQCLAGLSGFALLEEARTHFSKLLRRFLGVEGADDERRR